MVKTTDLSLLPPPKKQLEKHNPKNLNMSKISLLLMQHLRDNSFYWSIKMKLSLAATRLFFF